MKKYLLISSSILITTLSMILLGISLGTIINNLESTPMKINNNYMQLKKLENSPNSNLINSGLVSVTEYDPSIIIDLKYATTDNFLNKEIYPFQLALLQESTMIKLRNANEEFKKYGYRIKLWDSYRPYYIQKLLWEEIKDTRFIASPYINGSRHNRGAAVDITLVDENDKELVMPTKFDEFNEKAYRNSQKVSKEASENAKFLCDIMIKHGFTPIETEWWHFDDSNADTFPILDIKFEDLI